MKRILVLAVLWFGFLLLPDCLIAEEVAMRPQEHIAGVLFYPQNLPLLTVAPQYNPALLSSQQSVPADTRLLEWIRHNVSPRTGLFLSFEVPQEDKSSVYAGMGQADSVSGIIERVIVENGLVIYDGAVAQIALLLSGRDEDLLLASRPLEIYWEGRVGRLSNIRAGYERDNFVYAPADPGAVVSDLERKGERGFIFRIINAHGEYLSADPLDGKTEFAGFPTWPAIHWEDWKPVAGENAWVVMAAMQLFHRKHYDPQAHSYVFPAEPSIELQLAEELARAALLLQDSNGGIRMAPQGTYSEHDPQSQSSARSWWYDQISVENNFSWYGALRMLFVVTGKPVYGEALVRMEKFFQLVFDRDGQYFYQGMVSIDGEWRPNRKDFAVDVQTWGILALGPEKIDEWFGDGAALRAWQAAREFSGSRDSNGALLGVGFTKETGRVSVEWTAGAIMAVRALAEYYQAKDSRLEQELRREADEMRKAMETLRRDFDNGRAAYAYSSRRDWIPFGWNSHDPRVMSLAATGWIIFVDAGQNPFNLYKKTTP
jgi:hypothetical protein